MVSSKIFPRLYKVFFVAIFLQALTGCPGSGDRLEHDKEGYISINNGNACFSVNDSNDYALKYISINPRGTEFRNERVIFNPSLKVVNGLLCIPPLFFNFNKEGRYFIRASFASLKHTERPQRIVCALEVKSGQIYNIRPTDMEILRPYNEMIKN